MTKLVPVAHRILVKPDKLEDEQVLEKEYEGLAKSGFSLVKPDGADKREKRAVTSGVIVAIGPMAWKAFNGDHPDWKPWCQIGDKVEFARYAGELVFDPDTREELFVMNDEDILLIHKEGN